ncbi:MAG TPA: response regulator transcription factor [Candidatus Saccharimonadales bacterium]|nr:response regulator transcription factor [Candidatus Saccharimonadales bacterium]
MLSQHPLVLEELRSAIVKAGIQVVSRRASAPNAIDSKQVQVPRAKVYVIDAHAPRPSTEALVSAIQTRNPQSHILFVAEKFDKTSAFGLLQMGAKGLMRYPETRSQLPQALRAVATGGFWVPRTLLSSFVDSILKTGIKKRGSNWTTRLSQREAQVLELLLDNQSNKEIAVELNISERTVKFHVSNVLTKFGVHRRADLILLWYQKQLT